MLCPCSRLYPPDRFSPLLISMGNAALPLLPGSISAFDILPLIPSVSITCEPAWGLPHTLARVATPSFAIHHKTDTACIVRQAISSAADSFHSPQPHCSRVLTGSIPIIDIVAVRLSADETAQPIPVSVQPSIP